MSRIIGIFLDSTLSACGLQQTKWRVWCTWNTSRSLGRFSFPFTIGALAPSLEVGKAMIEKYAAGAIPPSEVEEDGRPIEMVSLLEGDVQKLVLRFGRVVEQTQAYAWSSDNRTPKPSTSKLN